MGRPRSTNAHREIVADFIAEHSDCTAQEIADALFEGDTLRVYAPVRMLRNAGRVLSYALPERKTVTVYRAIPKLADSVRVFLNSERDDAAVQALAEALDLHEQAVLCKDGRKRKEDR